MPRAKYLLNPQEIAPDLVHPTITEQADQRFEVFKQRIMAADNLINVANKYNLFPGQRKSMSEIQLRDLMRHSVGIKPVPLEMQPRWAHKRIFSDLRLRGSGPRRESGERVSHRDSQ